MTNQHHDHGAHKPGSGRGILSWLFSLFRRRSTMTKTLLDTSAQPRFLSARPTHHPQANAQALEQREYPPAGHVRKSGLDRLGNSVFPAFTIVYVDAEDIPTIRDIFPITTEQDGEGGTITAYCFLRKSERTFRASSILFCRNNSTKRRISDLVEYLCRTEFSRL